MDKDSKLIAIIGSIIAIALIGAAVYSVQNDKIPGALDDFATCLKDKGATFYGAFWCPHCQAQKKLFGRSVAKLPYVECSLPSGQGQTQVCIDNVTGEQSLKTLADKTGCELPDSAKTENATPIVASSSSSAQ